MNLKLDTFYVNTLTILRSSNRTFSIAAVQSNKQSMCEISPREKESSLRLICNTHNCVFTLWVVNTIFIRLIEPIRVCDVA